MIGRDKALPPDVDNDLLDDVVDEITTKLHAGQPVDGETYAARYPELAQRIRQLLPTLQAMAQLGHATTQPNDHGRSAAALGVLGDYRILREVGRGGMGVVYEAQQISLGRRVALKVLPFAAILDSRQLARFKNEAHAAACLQHQNIVPVYSVGCERGVHYYAMQYIEGQSLAQVIRHLRHLEHRDGGEQEAKVPDHGDAQAADNSVAEQLASGQFASGRRFGSDDLTTAFVPPSDSQVTGPLPEIAPSQVPTQPIAALSTSRSTKDPRYFHSIARLGIQAAEALDHAHKHGVIHRDIKPANLLLDGTGNLWITDFGLARIESDPGMTMTGDLVGTIRYMSPEQALAKRVIVDHRTDVYSLGVTLYELLTLEPAYTGRDRQELLKQIAFDEPRRPRAWNRAIPDDLETIVRKAMEKRPEDRYATAQDLADDLRRLLDDKPIAARRPTIFQHVARWSRRHRPLVASALSIGAILLVAVTLVSISQREIAQRRLRVQQGINEALTEVARLRGAAQATDGSVETALAQAREQLQRAVALAESEPIAPALLAQVQKLRDELDEEQQDRRLLATLEKAWLAQLETNPGQNVFLRHASVPFLRQALVDYGIRIGDTSPKLAAETIRSRPDVVKLQLLGAVEELRRLINHVGIGVKRVAGRTIVAQVSPDSPAGRDGRIRTGDQLLGIGYGPGVQVEDVGAVPLTAVQGWLWNTSGGAIRLQIISATHPEKQFFEIAADRAATWLRKVEEEADDDPWRRELRSAMDLTDDEQQRTVLEKLAQEADIQRQPVRILTDLGGWLIRLNANTVAVTFLGRIQRTHPNDTWANVALTTALSRSEPSQMEEAIRYATAVVALRPNSAGAHYNLGRALATNGRFDDAIAELETAVKLKPDYAAASIAVGHCLLALGKVDEALPQLRDAIRLDPTDDKAHTNLGVALIEKRFLDEAIAELREAIRLSPEVAAVHFNLAAALAGKGVLDEAIAECREAIRIEPTNATAHNNLAWLLATSPDPKYRDLVQALEYATKAVDLRPTNWTNWNTMGVARYRNGQWSESIAALQKSVELSKSGTPLDGLFLAMAHWQLGQKAEARQWYDKAITLIREKAITDPEVLRFRAEAEELLGITAESSPSAEQPKPPESPSPPAAEGGAKKEPS